MAMLLLDYQRVTRPVPRFGVGVLVLAVAGLATIGAQYFDVLESTDVIEARARELDRASPAQSLARGPRGEKEAAAMSLEIRQANEVLRQLSVPWDALFQAVEEAGGKEVTLLSMEPDPEKHVAKIVGEAKNIAAVLNYMRQLGRQPVLRDIYLQQHQVQKQDSEKPVRFAIVAGWELKS